jgi:hypothetical protein
VGNSQENFYRGSQSQTGMEAMTDRFDFEQQIMSCWGMVDDVKLLAKRGAESADFEALSAVYHHKFEELFEQFETLVHERKLT